ncbi:OprD family outer membrane porin [Maribacter aurantiacus]|uniref:Outer membrane porin, OprD family n=1 Tax=Maribacter aurantiacus TaxID=1882343 RepID=A0A5R8M488_9FLAO|nr:OprD family outer membrane porin [Maribacter aurantiacus]TLF44394.1 outer membrane porin, OprD family [Maribacter aurantiacus]
MRKIVILLILPLFLHSQDTSRPFVQGQLSGQWRNYFMHTANKGDLKDFRALATGGHLKYRLNVGNNFTVGAALYNSTNLGLQDLTVPDGITGRLSRYEEGQFDRLDLENDAIFLLGELYLEYKIKKHHFTLGRMKINTPMINPQDGRMIPTLVQGFWHRYKPNPGNTFQIGILNALAPRSTGGFFGIGESIGTYPVGRSIFGTESRYAGNTESDYIILFNSDVKLMENLQLGIWNYYVDNVFNTVYVKPRYRLNEAWTLEAEWLHQNKLGNGGNALDELQYFGQPSSDILGLQWLYVQNKTSISLGYDYILPGGQFLFPREWGREDLFSFQKRERSEGTYDNHALVLTYDTTFPVLKNDLDIRSIVSLGRHWKPSVIDAERNKYAMPDYTHINLDLFFNIKGLTNLKPELLVTGKFGNGDIPNNPNYFFNKVDMLHVDFILNYNF